MGGASVAAVDKRGGQPMHVSALPKRGPSIRGSRFVPVAGGEQHLREVLGYIGACHHLVGIYLCWQSADLSETIKTVGRSC